ncbi:MAG: hypothetical protein BWY03_00093 [Parcubacteria group bacterium ADurb.Bin159]|jgi:hypothetical protein|nr:MAG: hypothetical protein BWY03_00093 [Parcubacteria group bacterium ADurb.Bin159]
MKLKTYLKTLIICLIISWVIFALLFFVETPFYLHYFALFLGLSSTWSFLEFIWRTRRKKQPLFLQSSIAFRHSLWFSFLVVGFSLFQKFNILSPLNGVLFLIILGLLEFFFRITDKRYQP